VFLSQGSNYRANAEMAAEFRLGLEAFHDGVKGLQSFDDFLHTRRRGIIVSQLLFWECFLLAAFVIIHK
jgi:hypothetical protein